MAVRFTTSYRHGAIEFLPGVSIAFEDPDAETFFKKVGAATSTDDPPVRTYSSDEVDIDPATIFPDGTKVADCEVGEHTQHMRVAAAIQPDDVHVQAGAE